MLGKEEEERVWGGGEEKKGKGKEEGKVVGRPKEKKEVENNVVRLLLEYTSRQEDLVWANGGMVATVTSGDSTLSL